MTFFETLVVVGGTLGAVGLLVLGIASTRGAVLLGMREDAPWWFSPRGGRTQGFVLAYLGLLVALAGGVGLATRTFWAEATTLAWTLTWVSFVVLLSVSLTRAGRIGISLATDGRGVPDEPRDEDRVQAVVAADDPDLLAARKDALEGRWEPAAHLLAATGDAEMRQMRVDLLAEVAGRRRRWLDRWLEAAPRDRDALAVAAMTAYQRAAELGPGSPEHDPDRLAEALEDAEQAARLAVDVTPSDVSPRLTLLALAELQDLERSEFEARLAAALERAPGLRQTYETAVYYRENETSDSAAEVLAYAEQVAAASDAGRTTALLPAVAHLVHSIAIAQQDPRGAERYMQSEPVRASLRAASDRWMADPSPVCKAWGHNLLALCGWLAEDPELAAPHLVHTREALHPWPWLITGDPVEAHASARAWARHRLSDPTVLDVPEATKS